MAEPDGWGGSASCDGGDGFVDSDFTLLLRSVSIFCSGIDFATLNLLALRVRVDAILTGGGMSLHRSGRRPLCWLFVLVVGAK